MPVVVPESMVDHWSTLAPSIEVRSSLIKTGSVDEARGTKRYVVSSCAGAISQVDSNSQRGGTLVRKVYRSAAAKVAVVAVCTIWVELREPAPPTFKIPAGWYEVGTPVRNI